MFVSVMSEQRVASSDETDKEIVKEIKKNVASLKSSIDQILYDMEYIRTTKFEILEKLDCVRNEKSVDSAQIQVMLGKAKKIMKESEENRRKLELVLKKMNEFNFIHTFTNVIDPRDKDIVNLSNFGKINSEKNAKQNQIVLKEEKIKLRLLENNKYTLASGENKEKRGRTDLKWKRDSALRELQWIVKMKLYRLRHHYDKLPFELEVEERTPLPVPWRRVTGE